MMEVIIRHMEARDVSYIAQIIEDEGWNTPGNVLNAILQVQPDSLFVAEYKGKPVGCARGAKDGENFGIFGLFIVEKQLRGKGIGRKLMKTAHEYLGFFDQTRNIIVNSRLHLTKYYKNYGYQILSWHINVYAGTPDVFKMKNIVNQQENVKFEMISYANFEKVMMYDRAIYPGDRSLYINSMLHVDGVLGYCAVLYGQVVGYGLLIPKVGTKGYCMRPLYANSVGICQGLVKEMCLSRHDTNQGVTLHSVEVNESNMNTLAEYMGIEYQYKLRRLYSLREIKLDFKNVYSLANQSGFVV